MVNMKNKIMITEEAKKQFAETIERAINKAKAFDDFDTQIQCEEFYTEEQG